MMKKIILSVVLGMSCFSMAEDIELYVGTTAQRTGGNAKVLIIFDNSGSMASNTLSAKNPYNPNTAYPAIGDLQITPNEPIYFTKGVGIDSVVPVPDGPNERRRFLGAINGCESSKAILDTVGFYTGYFREYKYQGQSGAWKEIPDNNGLNIEVLDCLADINSGNAKNADGMEDGFPIDGLGTNRNPDYYTEAVADSNTHFGEGAIVTLYSANYLRWAQAEADDIGVSDQTRLEIAQTTISNFIVSNPNVDFGLQVFNVNAYSENEKDGGRVVFGIQNMDVAAKTKVLDIINNQIDGETNTPLCETLYEASRYFGGKSVEYGNDDGDLDGYTANTPARDDKIESEGVYQTPFDDCTKEVFTILITDGNPTLDRAADSAISALDGVGTAFDVDGTGNYLAELAGWMHHHDLITGATATLDANGDEDFDSIRNNTLNTIGFGFVDANVEDYVEPDAVKLLKTAATKGGGTYFAATDQTGLKDSLDKVIFEISKSHGSFTAPAVATNNFDRTTTLSSMYYAMFQPDRGPRWAGNLKKLKVTAQGIEDQNELLAINTEGNIIDTAKTFWTTGPADGNTVEDGGAAQMLRAKTNRVFLSDVKLGDEGQLLPLTRANALETHTTTEALALELNVVDDEAHQNIDNMLAWAKGVNVDQVPVGDTIPAIRYDVMGDPLHSKPLAINYGTAEAEDIRVLVGTNAGVLHMFSDAGTTIDESWAFMPKDFLKNISHLRENYPSSEKIYGIDGTATVYITDVDGDGAVDAGTDKVWLFFGLRRGGNSYYALDISLKDTPKLMWHKTFAGAGQSWSKPEIAYSKINTSNDIAKPVLIIGAGYSPAKDNPSVGGNDTIGNGIFMLDAESGDLIWRLSGEDGLTEITTAFSGTDSIPASIATLDSDADGFVDRLYAGDTGGNVWRVDMPGNAISDWTVVKKASLGSSIDTVNDRRFFKAPTVVRALIKETISTTTVHEGVETVVIDRFDKPYDAILLGSGDSTNPIGIDTEDKFFMIKDEQIVTQSLTGDLVPSVVELTDLKDFSDEPFKGLEGDALNDELIEATSQSGWYFDFDEFSGEKSTSSALVISGVVYFGTFSPAPLPVGEAVCSVLSGGSALYAVGLSLGINVYNWESSRIDTTDHITDGLIPIIRRPEHVDGSDPQPLVIEIIGPNPISVVGCENSDCSVTGIPGVETQRTYLYTTEN
jgi:type IV pilus assembly protein PilY1